MTFVRACVSVLGLALVATGCPSPPPGGSDESSTSSGDVSSSEPTSSSADTSTTGSSTSDDTLDDTGSTCGNGVVDPDEDCDGLDLAGGTCEALGFDGGTLSCSGACSYDTSSCSDSPGAPLLELGFSPIKQFDFGWMAIADADHYQLLESATPGDPFTQLGDDIVGESISLTMPLHLRHEASYMLRACNVIGCTDSDPVSVVGSLAEATGYFKASNTGSGDSFGTSVALSGDGNTLAVGASAESSSATGVDGNQADDSAFQAGAVYVFVRDARGQWSQQAYLKASNSDAGDLFGASVALSDDGTTLAVGAFHEASNATGIDGDQANNSAIFAGVVYVFERDAMDQWSQQAYVKASNPDAGDEFGTSVALSSDGTTLAVGAPLEDSNATGIGGNQANNSAGAAGAAYVFVRDGMDQWSQQAYLKASNTDADDFFGASVALSGDGTTLAVGAVLEDGNATGIDGNQADDSTNNAGAAYVFVRDAMDQWSQQAYVKASNTEANDFFGWSVALSGDGSTLAVAALNEDSGATGIDGDQASNSAADSGGVYVLVRDAMDQWSQQAYVKSSNPGAVDNFGRAMALGSDGSTLAVAAIFESGSATGIGGDDADDSASSAGAAYVLVRDTMGQWSQRAYVKAPNTDASDGFGAALALSSDGNALAVGAYQEGSSATGIGGDQADDATGNAGAVYLF